ncbi:iripin-3-like [Haemaphysalis longicornis]
MTVGLLFVIGISACYGARNAQAGLVHEACDILGYRLLPVLSRKEQPNVLYSPHSLSSLMGMVYAGARGSTKKELFRTLGYKEARVAEDEILELHKAHNERLRQITNSTVSSANAGALKKGLRILPTYRTSLKESFDAELFTVDFKKKGEAAVRTINDWVGTHTRGLIPELFDKPLPPDTQMVVLNAVYFKGLWVTEFNKSETKRLPFYNDGRQATQVDTMTGKFRASYGRFDDLDCDILELPYKIADYSMTIMLPRRRDGIASLRKLPMHSFRQALEKLRENTEVKIRLPKFKLATKYHLKDTFERVGIRSVFDPHKADLSGVTGHKGLYLSGVIHKAVIEVDEKGTKAAAASATNMVVACLGCTIDEFYADHPFMFCIRSKNSGVLFMGEVNRL